MKMPETEPHISTFSMKIIEAKEEEHKGLYVLIVCREVIKGLYGKSTELLSNFFFEYWNDIEKWIKTKRNTSLISYLANKRQLNINDLKEKYQLIVSYYK